MVTVVGICGVIGSGKSLVRRIFEVLYELPTYDCDAKAKELYYHPTVRREIEQAFGEDPIDSDGRLRRDFLTSLLVQDTDRYRLEEINHRALFEDFEVWRKSQEVRSEVVVAESAILFSSGFYRVCDHTIMIEASETVRRERVKHRDRDKGEGFFEKISALQREEERLQREGADFKIDNDGDTALVPQVEYIFKQLTSNT
ncbi:MAG: dephospho-CoA kinase [Porphyromonas sp.]|nr:dephospho-CoA kinase [Porphyromonas sp.]